jgi:hypothetical protein
MFGAGCSITPRSSPVVSWRRYVGISMSLAPSTARVPTSAKPLVRVEATVPGIPVWANSADIERLRAAVLASASASDRLTKWIIGLAVVLVLLTLALVGLTVALVIN